MRIRWSLFAIAGILFAGSLANAMHAPQAQRPANPNGWVIPPDGDKEKNPVAGDAKAIEAGKALYNKNCERCHGASGKGDGPDGDPDHQQDMDLTNARRAARNPDGTVFYKVWNGRKSPKMPAFKDEGLSKDQVWRIVAYAQTLRSAQ